MSNLSDPRQTTGYIRGRPFPLIVVRVESGHWLECETAAAFLMMQDAAKKDGVHLRVSSGFRFMDEQQRLWEERRDPNVRAEKGIAAKPGYSRHQRGTAVDIVTGMSLRQFAQGKTTKVYLWLEKHAAKYGFKRTVKSEPWHWAYCGMPEPSEVDDR